MITLRSIPQKSKTGDPKLRERDNHLIIMMLLFQRGLPLFIKLVLFLSSLLKFAELLYHTSIVCVRVTLQRMPYSEGTVRFAIQVLSPSANFASAVDNSSNAWAKSVTMSRPPGSQVPQNLFEIVHNIHDIYLRARGRRKSALHKTEVHCSRASH